MRMRPLVLQLVLVLASVAWAQDQGWWDAENTTTTDAPNTTTTPEPGADAALWETIMAFLIVVIMLVVLAVEIGSTEAVMFLANLSFVVLQITTVGDAVAGFSNSGMLTVAVLFPIARALELTGALEPLQRLLAWLAARNGKPRSLAQIVCFSMFPLALISGFINNTPLVATQNLYLIFI